MFLIVHIKLMVCWLCVFFRSNVKSSFATLKLHFWNFGINNEYKLSIYTLKQNTLCCCVLPRVQSLEPKSAVRAKIRAADFLQSKEPKVAWESNRGCNLLDMSL